MHDGGQAFPNVQASDGEGRIVHYAEPGMTLRDYFAGEALGGYLAGRSNLDARGSTTEAVAVNCYAYADAMIEARKSIGVGPLVSSLGLGDLPTRSRKAIRRLLEARPSVRLSWLTQENLTAECIRNCGAATIRSVAAWARDQAAL